MKEKIFSYLLALVSAALLIFSFPPFSSGWFIWFALVPVLVATQRVSSAKKSATLFGFCGILFYSVSLHWLTKIFGIFAVSLFCLLAIFWIAFGFFYYRCSKLQKIFLAPFLWTGLEFFRSEIWYFEFPWMSLGLAHHTDFFSSTLQLASLWGVYGNSFLIFIVNALLASLFHPNTRLKKISALFGAVLISCMIIPFFATMAGYLHSSKNAAETLRFEPIKVLLVQSEKYNLDELIQITRNSQFQGGIILWPEYQVPILPGKKLKEDAYKRMAELAKKTKSVLLAGCAEFLVAEKSSKQEKIHNYVVAFNPDGSVAGATTKRHPIPLMEKFILLRGESAEPIPTAFGKIGVVICYDMDFTESVTKVSKEGAELIASPSLDPDRWGVWEHLQHASLARVRAVEGRKWLIRAASSGPSQVVDPSGREISTTRIGEETVLKGAVYLTDKLSFYHRGGWIFPWVCFALTCLVTVLYAVRNFTISNWAYILAGRRRLFLP